MRFATLSLLLALATGCYTVHGSSRDHLGEVESQLFLPRPPDAVAGEVVAAFGRRGFHLVDRKATADAVTFRFKGSRATLSTVSGFGSGGSLWVGGQSDVVGSAFYASLRGHDGGTQVWFFGRPTVQGREACQPPQVDFPCDGAVSLPLASPAIRVASGREEAETLRGMALELGGLGASQPAAGAPVTTTATASSPVAVAVPAAPTWGAPARIDGAPPEGFVKATLRSGALLRAAPDPSAPVKATLRGEEEAWVVSEPTRGYRRARTASGLTGFAAEGDVQVGP
jgi:hypothetical protein